MSIATSGSFLVADDPIQIRCLASDLAQRRVDRRSIFSCVTEIVLDNDHLTMHAVWSHRDDFTLVTDHIRTTYPDAKIFATYTSEIDPYSASCQQFGGGIEAREGEMTARCTECAATGDGQLAHRADCSAQQLDVNNGEYPEIEWVPSFEIDPALARLLP